MHYPDFFKLCVDWTNFFYNHEMEDILSDISEKTDGKIKFPDEKCVFRCFELTPFKTVSVVFIGNRPTSCSTGLSYEVKRGNIFTREIQSIYKELEDEGYYPTKDGNLEHWAKQGVLLLNRSLTMLKDEKEDEENDMWDPFFKKVIELLSTKDNIIWVFDKEIRKYIHLFSNQTHLLLKNGPNIFKTINRHLYKNGYDKISW